MSNFSELLSLYVQSKKIKTYAMAQYCDLDRSTMYKIINGKRNPTNEATVHKIAGFMNLCEKEHNQLVEAYHISIIGDEVYNRRKAVFEFFANFATDLPVFPNFKINTTSFKMVPSVLSINGRTEIDHVTYSALLLETQKEDGHIKLLLQPENTFIMKLLSFISREKSTLKIDHLICLNNTESVSMSKENYNLQCLNNIMPLYIASCNYNSYYYYENILSHNNVYNLLPCLILTSDYAITLSIDMKYGIIYRDSEMLTFFDKIFSKYLSDTSKIGIRIHNLSTALEHLPLSNKDYISSVSFQSGSGLAPLLSEKMILKYLHKNFLSCIESMNFFMYHVQSSMAAIKGKIVTFIFTLDTITTFLETGRISELPSHIYNAFSMSDRLRLIDQLIHVCKNYNYKLLKENIQHTQNILYIYTNPQHTYLLFPSAKNELVYLDLKEPSILYAFYDYWTSLNDNLFYNREETIHILDKLKQKYRMNL